MGKGTAAEIKSEIQGDQMCSAPVTDSCWSLTGSLLLSAKLWSSLQTECEQLLLWFISTYDKRLSLSPVYPPVIKATTIRSIRPKGSPAWLSAYGKPAQKWMSVNIPNCKEVCTNMFILIIHSNRRLDYVNVTWLCWKCWQMFKMFSFLMQKVSTINPKSQWILNTVREYKQLWQCKMSQFVT